MNSNEKELDALLTHYESRLQQKQTLERQVVVQENAWSEKFSTMLDDIVGPVFDRYKQKLIAAGHEARISVVSRHGRGLEFVMRPKGYRRGFGEGAVSLPTVRFVHHSGDTVSLPHDVVSPSGSGHSGGSFGGETVAISAIDEALVEAQIVRVLKASLKG